MSASRHDAGFTLVEVLIALFIFAIVATGSMTALTTTLRGQAQLEDKLSQVQAIETTRALMKSDMASIILRQNRNPYGGKEQYVLRGGDDTVLTFTRSGRVNPGGIDKRSDLIRVSYVFEDRKLIRRTLDQVDPAPQAEARDRVLFDDVADVDVQFFTSKMALPSGNGQAANFPNITVGSSQVQVRAGQQNDIPNYVSLTLTFLSGDKLTQLFEVQL